MGAAQDIDKTEIETELVAPVKDAPITRATLFVSRDTVRTVLTKELSNYGIPDIKAQESIEDCIDDLKKNPASLLVIDWEHGEESVSRVLTAAQGPHRVDTRPIYFLALDISERVVSIAHEFNVSLIHTGEITQADIMKHLDDIVHNSLMSPLCRQTFREVADLRRKGDKPMVVSKLRDLCDREPTNLRASVELAFSYCDANMLDDADRWLHSVSTRYPNDLRTKHLQARCAMRRGQFERAYEILQEASLISPNNVERLVELGNILLNMDRVKEAMSRFKQALKLDENSREAKTGRSQCKMLLGQVNEAVKLLGQMDNPEELASVFNGAAILAIRQQRFEQGLDLYKAAIGFVSHDNSSVARVFFNMGVGLVKWGKPKAALTAFERAAELDPKLEKAKHNQNVLQASFKKGGAPSKAPEKTPEVVEVEVASPSKEEAAAQPSFIEDVD